MYICAEAGGPAPFAFSEGVGVKFELVNWAAGEGFEPPVLFRAQQFSKLPHSSALASRQLSRVDPRGIEPLTLPCHGSMLPVYHGPLMFTL